MTKIQLNRKVMAELLFSLKGFENSSPLQVILNSDEHVQKKDIPEFILKFEKRRTKKNFGLSTNEIVALGNLCELTSLKSTSIQNWIKRDVKEIIGPPELGKKYSIEQTALLLIVKDLKAVFDFETIRNLLMKVFNTLSDRSDDLISPLIFYKLYALILENLRDIVVHSTLKGPLEKKIEKEVFKLLQKEMNINNSQNKEIISRILVITILSVLSSHIQLRTLRYAEQLLK